MRNFEYAILAEFSATLNRGKSLKNFRTRGWILSKTTTNTGSVRFDIEANEEIKNLDIELEQRREKWNIQFSGKRSRKVGVKEKNQENLLQHEIQIKSHELSWSFV